MQALDQRDFETATQLLDNGEGIPPNLDIYALGRIFDQLIRHKQYDLLLALSKKGFVPNDIYEFDRFSHSIYADIFRVNEPDEALLSMLSQLLSAADNVQDEVEGETLLSYAIHQGAHPEVIKTLIDAGLDVGIRNNSDETLIHKLTRYSRTAVERQLDYLDLLIAEGIDVNATNVVKKTALHMAIENNKPQLLDRLLQEGANPNEQDAEGNSAYFYAIAHKLDLNLYRQLAAYEPMDFEQRNKEGVGAFHEYLRMLTASYETNPELLVQLLADGADLNSKSPYYSVPKSGWQWVVVKDPVVLEEALKACAHDVNEMDEQGNTLLHYVCAIDCNYDQNVAKNIYRKVKTLLNHGADPALINNKEESALQLASNDNLKVKTVELLLTHQQRN